MFCEAKVTKIHLGTSLNFFFNWHGNIWDDIDNK